MTEEIMHDEIRRFWESCGWTYHEWTEPTQDSIAEKFRRWSPPLGWKQHHTTNYLPDHNDLNVLLEALEWFCAKHKLFWSLENGRPWYAVHDPYVCIIFARTNFHSGNIGGKTKQDVIIRAVLACWELDSLDSSPYRPVCPGEIW